MYTKQIYEDFLQSFNSFHPTLPKFSSTKKAGESFIFYYGSRPFEPKPYFGLDITNSDGLPETYASGCICSTSLMNSLSPMEDKRDRLNYCEFKSVISDSTRILLFTSNPFTQGEITSLTEMTLSSALLLYANPTLSYNLPSQLYFILPEEYCKELQDLPYHETLSMDLGDIVKGDKYMAKLLHYFFCREIRNNYGRDLYLRSSGANTFRLCFTDLIYLEVRAIKDSNNIVNLDYLNLDWIETNISKTSLDYNILKSIVKDINDLNNHNRG